MPPKHKHAAAPKRKSVAIKPKAKPKAAAPRKRCNAAPPSALEAPEEEEAESMLGGGKTARAKRENKRRDTDEQVDMIITTRLLPDYDTINATVNEAGISVSRCVGDRIRLTRTSNQYLTTKLWTDFYEQFPIQG